MPGFEAPRAIEAEEGRATNVSYDDAGAFMRVQQAAMRKRIIIAVAILAAIALAIIGWKVMGDRVSLRDTPKEGLAEVDEALAGLRGDDTNSKKAAVAKFEALVVKYPEFVDAHAGLVTALSLRVDDLSQRWKRLDLRRKDRERRAQRYSDEKSPADWEVKYGTLIEEAKRIAVDYEAVVAEYKPLSDQLVGAFHRMETTVEKDARLPKQSVLAVTRAEALYFAVSGNGEAITRVERFANVSGGQAIDSWVEMAKAEYVLNASASGDLQTEAAARLSKLAAADSSLFRPRVLTARLDFQQKRLDDALAALEDVLIKKPTHDVAAELKEWITRAKAESDG